MYEAGVRYVIQSEALAVQPSCLALTRPPCANARTHTRLEPVAALCVCTRVAYTTTTPLIRYANSRRELMPSFFSCAHKGARYSAADAQSQFAGKINIHGRLHPSAQSGHGRGAVQRKPKTARAILGREGVNPWRLASVGQARHSDIALARGCPSSSRASSHLQGRARDSMLSSRLQLRGGAVPFAVAARHIFTFFFDFYIMRVFNFIIT